MREFAFVNGTGSTIPAGAALRPTGVNAAGFTTVAQANADSSMYVIFNAPVDVANGAYGVAFGWDGGVVPVAVDPADEPYTSADTFGTKSGDWRLRKGFKGFRLPTASVQGIANAVPDPAGDVGTAANWSSTVTGLVTAAAQTGGGGKTSVRGTDASRGAWWTQETEIAADASAQYLPYNAAYTTVAGMTTAAALTGGMWIGLRPITTPFGGTPVFSDQIATVISALHQGSQATQILFLEGTGATKRYLALTGGLSTPAHYAHLRGGVLIEGQDRTVAGLVFTGGIITGGTLAVPVANLTGLGTGVATFLATPSSANLRAALTDETGTGVAVFADSPTLTNPVVGTQTAGDNSTKAASTAYVDGAISTAVAGTTVSASYNSGTKDLTITANGVSTVVNLT